MHVAVFCRIRSLTISTSIVFSHNWKNPFSYVCALDSLDLSDVCSRMLSRKSIMQQIEYFSPCLLHYLKLAKSISHLVLLQRYIAGEQFLTMFITRSISVLISYSNMPGRRDCKGKVACKRQSTICSFAGISNKYPCCCWHLCIFEWKD